MRGKSMRVIGLLLVIAMIVGAALEMSGCDRKEVIDQVGGAPKAQVDQARDRAKAAEAKLQQNAAAASAATE